eukprot:gnl/TRDRNA2_/TRDRNA2_126378_c0_seq2.p1 gnl/TRDRNA2_/TRDRNA2_126378_c0~~gnl/TRDRNA2_/TRDRNA2_126378_c0_seq2.p1  ORF type:complete len:851 (-),score=151.96 gnl/TRDRNA2_/TRDRNA2_126378_c0_seq2:62-2614(-)
MGDAQSRAAGVTPTGDPDGDAGVGTAAAAADQDTACGDVPLQVSAAPDGAATPSDQATAVSASSESSPQSAAALPSESEILARLVASLGQCPGRSLPLAELQRMVPQPYRHLAEDTAAIRKWLGGFPGLLEVSGSPGEELVTLTLGRPAAVRPGAETSAAPKIGSSAASSVAAPAAGDTAAPAAGSAAVTPAPAPAATAPAAPVVPATAAMEASEDAEVNAASNEDSALLAGAVDEDGMNPCAVQLRGLPFRATIADIKAFLGSHAEALIASEPAVRLLLNRDGRPSGFARVQFASPDAARAAREALHRTTMGDRYVEVLSCSERPGKARHRRAAPLEVGVMDVTNGPGGVGGSNDAAERERVLQECREHMRLPGRQQLLLSMLGIALSPPTRAYLRRADLGLKHFLARYPNEFRVEGPKGCEKIVWCPGGAAPSVDGAAAVVEALVDAPPSLGPREPHTPQPSQTPNPRGASSVGHLFATPSDWGTPTGDSRHRPGSGQAARDKTTQQQAAQQSGEPSAGAAMGDFPPYPGYWPGAYGWMPGPYGWMPPWGQWDPTAMDPTAATKTFKEQAGKASGGKKGSGGAAASNNSGGSRPVDAPPPRSHAHLHPQSHPFAHRPRAGAAEGGPGAATPSAAATSGANGTVAGDLAAMAQSPSCAALRLRGLPFGVTVQDVLAFFAQHDVADRIADGKQAAQLLPKANGRPSGQAVVQMRSRTDAEVARRALHHQWVEGRYIEAEGGSTAAGPPPAAAFPGWAVGDMGSGASGPGGAVPGFSGFPPWGPMPPPWAALGQAPLQPPPVPGASSAGGEEKAGTFDDQFSSFFDFLQNGAATGDASVAGEAKSRAQTVV